MWRVQVWTRQAPDKNHLEVLPQESSFLRAQPCPETGPSERSDSKVPIVPTMVTVTLWLDLDRRQHAGSHTGVGGWGWGWAGENDQFLTNYSPQTTLSTPPLPGTIQGHFRLGRAS